MITFVYCRGFFTKLTAFAIYLFVTPAKEPQFLLIAYAHFSNRKLSQGYVGKEFYSV